MESDMEPGEVKEQEEESGTAASPEEEAETLKARVEELEKTLSLRNAEVLALKENGRRAEKTTKNLEQSLTEAVGSYKTLVTTMHPAVPGELITGESIGAIDASLATAKALVLRVRQGIEAETNGMKIPAGAPERGTPDYSGLSTIEKIKLGLGGKR